MIKCRLAAILGAFAMALTLNAALAVADGATIYAKCKGCHGADGKGNANLAKAFRVDPEQLDLTKPETQKKDNATLQKLVKEGSGKMKGMGDKLKDDEIAAVVAHLRTLAKNK